MNDGPRAELAQHVDAIESAYEFMLAYAAQGREGDDDAGNSSGIRRSLTELASALEDLVAVCKALVGDDLAHYQAFLDVVDIDASKARSAIQMVQAQSAISSQLIDNLNASIHLRALLTDLFLIDEALNSKSG